MLSQGLVQIYTCETSHANYAPYGLSLRAAGQGLKTCIVLISTQISRDLIRSVSHLLASNLTVNDLSAAVRDPTGISGYLSEICKSGQYDLVIFEGIHALLKAKPAFIGKICELLESKPSHVELILTGQHMPFEILNKADLVTEMKVTEKTNSMSTDRYSHTGRTVVITGHGKGKTTYCLGRAMFMSCQGITARMVQYVKSSKPYGEVKAVSRFPGFRIISMGKGMVGGDADRDKAKHFLAAEKAWVLSKKEVKELKRGLLVLDEINIATRYKWLTANQVKEVILRKAKPLELLLSGRDASEEIKEKADRVMEMKKIKHPFDRGIKARKGIEY